MTALAESPTTLTLLEAARGLALAGDDEAARRAYLDLLRADATCLAALLELARLALRGGHRQAARTLYHQAILCHPAEPTARVNLANLMIESGEFASARAELEAAIALLPTLAAAHQGLARVLTALGQPEAAAEHWRLALGAGGFAPQAYAGAGPGTPVLLLVSARGGNIPTRSLLDDTVFAVTALYAEHYDARLPLPPHALVFNAIGDADLCGEALENAAAVVARSAAPVLNPPDLVRATTRDEVIRRLGALADVVAPQTRRVSRAALLQGGDDLAFPRLLRAPGFHTGQHFLRVERREDLAAALAELPGDELFAIAPLDARGPDGLHRKYRVMLIGGAPYPLHLAVSAHWKVHYFSADMAASPAHRAEEAAFLADMEAAIGPRALAALAAIGAELGLDYAGVDFAVAPDGRLLLFEANPGMVISPPGPEAIWNYRRAPIERALEAVRRLLLARASAPA